MIAGEGVGNPRGDDFLQLVEREVADIVVGDFEHFYAFVVIMQELSGFFVDVAGQLVAMNEIVVLYDSAVSEYKFAVFEPFLYINRMYDVVCGEQYVLFFIKYRSGISSTDFDI